VQIQSFHQDPRIVSHDEILPQTRDDLADPSLKTLINENEDFPIKKKRNKSQTI